MNEPGSLVVIAAALVTIVISGLVGWQASVRAKGFKPGDRMGDAKWDFKDSWASTITVVGGALATVVTTASVGLPTVDPTPTAGIPTLAPTPTAGTPNLESAPSTRLPAPEFTPIVGPPTTAAAQPKELLPRGQYAGLSLLFAFTVLFAGLAYSATRRPREVKGKGKVEIQFQGYVWSFLLAAWLTVWAVYGQLIALVFAVYDLAGRGSLTWFSAVVFVAILVVAGFVLAVHAVLSIVDALKYSSDRGLTKALDEAMDRRAEALSKAAASGHLPPQLAPRLPDWSLP